MRTIATELRLLLAMRGWVNPLDLLPAMPREESLAVLDELAPVIDFAPSSGVWFLSDDERRLVLCTTPAALLEVAIAKRGPADAADPVRQALELRRNRLPDDLEALPSDVLRALGSSFKWLSSLPADGGFWAREPDHEGARARVAAAIAGQREKA